MNTGKTPEWEAELWSYVCSGNGKCCFLYDHCRSRQKGDWCPNDNVRRINRLLDEKRFDPGKYDWINGGETCNIIQLVERLAQKYFKMGGIDSPPVPIALIEVVDPRRTVEVRMIPLTTYHAAVWCLKDSWIVQLNKNDTPATQRFTLFHEAFHILAHCKTTPTFKKRGAKQGTFNELLADYFAVYLLIPREWAKEKWAEVKDLNKMAEIFDVPESLMWIRLRELGLI